MNGRRSASQAASAPVLLFDLGGVVLDFRGPEGLHALTDNRYTLEEIRARWADSPSLATFEAGHSDSEEFARAFIAEWRLTLSAQQ